MFDGLLRLLEDTIRDRFATYADDLVVVIDENSRKELETTSQQVANAIVSWCETSDLGTKD